MKRSAFLVISLIVLFFTFNVEAQNRRRIPLKPKNLSVPKISNTVVVIDERLAVLRAEPGFYSRIIQRVRRGRTFTISGTREADGVTFYRVNAAPSSSWIQAEAVTGKFRRGDDARLAKLVQSSKGFEQIDRAQIFLETFDDSTLRPAVLLLFGDVIEEIALKLSGEATNRLDRREMAASGAPLHSFYLNYTSLDRYRRRDVNFLFNSNTKLFHYDGASWREIIKNFPKTLEATEAQRRIDSLKAKLEKTK